jgi:NTE family protein
MANKTACLISGGGSWGAFGGGTLAKLNKEYNTVVGISAGSLLAPMTALKEWDILKRNYIEITNANVFDKYWYKPFPITKQGKLNKFAIIMTLLMDQKTIATSNALRKTINAFLPEGCFNELRRQGKEILVGTQNYAQIPSKVHYFSSLEQDYEEFKDWMWCSACSLFYMTLVKKSWRGPEGNFYIGNWCDGRIVDLIGIDQLMNRGFKEIDIILCRAKSQEKYEGNIIDNLMENIVTDINALRYGIESEYFYERISRLTKQGTKVTVYWLPRKLSKNSMVFNEKEMTAWWQEGYDSALNPNRIEVFEPERW